VISLFYRCEFYPYASRIVIYNITNCKKSESGTELGREGHGQARSWAEQEMDGLESVLDLTALIRRREGSFWDGRVIRDE